MAKYTDRNGTEHCLNLHGKACAEVKKRIGIDFMQCIKTPKAVEDVLQKLSEPAAVMATCAVIEGVPLEKLDDFYGLWNGDTFEDATNALLEAIADFFPKGPRAVFLRILEKARDAVQRKQEVGTAKALQMLEQMDFLSEASGS